MDVYALPLAQEIIELIVRVRESTSDIEFIYGGNRSVSSDSTGNEPEGLTRRAWAHFAPDRRTVRLAPCRNISVKYGKRAALQVRVETLIDKGNPGTLYMTHLVNNSVLME